MKKTVFIIIILISISTFCYGQSKRDDISKLLSISGTSEIADQMMGVMMTQFQQLFPDIPNMVWARLREKFDVNGLINACIPAYDRHLTHDEVRQLIAFYESPIGRRLVAVTPLINQETMVIGQRWGEQIGQDIVNELIREGYLGN